MAEPLRNNLQAPALDEPSIDQLLAGFVPAERTLPSAQNPRLNRTAETIGTALGTTVGKVRFGLTVVRDREREMAREIKSTISQQAETITAVAMERAEQLGDVAEAKAFEAFNAAQKQWDALSDAARERLISARKQAAELREEHPLELILGFAAAAFALGATLKIWRSTHD